MIFQTAFPPAAEGRGRAAALPAPRQLAIQLLFSCLNNQDAAPPTGLHLITPQPMNRSCGAICLPLTTSPLLQNLPRVLLGVLVYQSEARSFHGPSGGQKAGREVVLRLWERFSCPDIGAGPHGPSAPGFPALLVMWDQGGCSKFTESYQKPEHEQTQQTLQQAMKEGYVCSAQSMSQHEPLGNWGKSDSLWLVFQ